LYICDCEGCPENGFPGNVSRFPEKSKVCPSDNEPLVRFYKLS